MIAMIVFSVLGFLIGYNVLVPSMEGGFMGAALGILVVLCSSQIVPHETTISEKEKTEIVGIKCVVVVVPGQSGVESFYEFDFTTSDGRKESLKLSAKNVIVHEGGGTYFAKVYEKSKYPKWFFWIFQKYFLMEREYFSEKYAVHIPKGKIKVEYKLNLD